MTDFASLVLGIDSTQVKAGVAELDKLAASGGNTTRAVNELAAANKASELAASRAAAGLVKASSAEGQLRMQASSATAEMNRQVVAASRVAVAGHAVTASAGQQRAGMQQLSFQIGDVAQQFALGTNPMVIFAQQGEQVVQALSMMKGGASGLLGFLAGPWGAVIMGATMILGSLWAAHTKAADGEDEQKDAAEDLIKSIDALNDATLRATRSTEASTIASMANAIAKRQQAQDTLALAKDELVLARASSARAEAGMSGLGALGGGGGNSLVYLRAQGDISALEGKISKLEQSVGKATGSIRLMQGQIITSRLSEHFDKGAAATGKYSREMDRLNAELSKTGNMEAFAQGAFKAKSVLEAEQKAAQAASRSHRERKAAISDEARELIAATKAAESYVENLNKETASIGKNAIEIKRMAVEAAASEAAKAGLSKEAASIRAAGAAWETSTRAMANKEMDAYLAKLEGEVKLLGLTGLAREQASLALEKEAWLASEAAKGVGDLQARWERYAAARIATATFAETKKAAEDAAAALQAYLDMSQSIDLDGVFGNAGKAFGSLLNTMDQMIERQEKYNAAIAAGGLSAAKLSAIRSHHARDEINNYGNIVAAAKGFFKENSKGYKIMQAAETAFRAIELAMAIKSAVTRIALSGSVAGAAAAGAATEVAATASAETAKTGISLAGALARIPVKVAEGAASIFAALGPFGFPVVAAMLGVMASLGFSSSGGSKTKPVYNEGKGTVFGDGSAQSESIKRSIDHLTEVDTLTMRYSSQMLASLRNIETNIGGLTGMILRTSGIDNLSASVKTGTSSGLIGKVQKRAAGWMIGATIGSMVAGPLGALLGGAIGAITGVLKKIPIIGDVIGVIGTIGKALFGTKTKIVGQGISAGPQSLGSILGDGFDASYFTNIKKKKKFFGITSSTKYSTKYADASDEIEHQFGMILKGFYDSILAAAGPLGMSLDEVKAKLATFTVDIGKIDLKGLTGAEIQEKLTAVFGAAADKMAQYALAGLDQYQQAGEGYFETMVRVAQTVEASRMQFGMLGASVSTLTVGVSMALTDLFGGLQNMIAATDEYFSLFYTTAEQAAARTAQLTSALAGLGLTMPTTMAGYRALVEAQDLTTAAGQSAYAMLIQLAPAFAELTGAVQDAASIAAIASERAGLEKQLLQAQGDTAALRALDLAQLDVSNRALQQQIWALEDASKAREAASNTLTEAYNRESQELSATASKFSAFGDSLRTFRATLFAADSATGNAYRTAQVKLMMTGALAASGDAAALGDLQGVSKTFLDAAMNNASTSQQYQRDVAMVARYVDQGIAAADGAATIAEQQLDALKQSVTGLIDINDSVVSVHDAILAMAALTNPSQAQQPAAQQSDAQQNERLDRIERLHQRQLEETTQMRMMWNRMTRDGSSLIVATDDDTPLRTEASA